MENITNIDLSSILILLSAVYPPLLFLLPSSYAVKINVGVKILKKVVDTLEVLQNSKAGLSFDNEIKTDIKQTFTQKSKN